MLDHLPGIDASVLDNDVEAAVELDGQCNRRLGLGQSGNVRSNERRAKFIGCTSDHVAVDIGKHEPCSLLAKALSDRLADSCSRADDQGNPAFDPSCHASLWRMVSFSVSRSTAASTSRPCTTWVKFEGSPIKLIAVLMAESSSTPA